VFELIFFGLALWGICAMIKAWARSREEERERQRAEDELRRRAAEHQRWRDSLTGTEDGVSRFALALEANLADGDWASVRAMVDTLPDWPIRELIHQAMAEAVNLYRTIDLAYSAGVHPATCQKIYEGELEQERVLWRILVNTAIVSQTAGPSIPWRRLPRTVRRGVDEDRREVEEIIARIRRAFSSLQASMAWPDRSHYGLPGRSLDDATRTADHITRTWRRPGR
jgi:hypothetical protein